MLPRTQGQMQAAERLEKWEVRSFEAEQLIGNRFSRVLR